MTFILLSAAIIDSLYNVHMRFFNTNMGLWECHLPSVGNTLFRLSMGCWYLFHFFLIFVKSLKGLKVLVSSHHFLKISLKGSERKTQFSMELIFVSAGFTLNNNTVLKNCIVISSCEVALCSVVLAHLLILQQHTLNCSTNDTTCEEIIPTMWFISLQAKPLGTGSSAFAYYTETEEQPDLKTVAR